MQQMAGGLERIGYEPYFMNLTNLATGAYTNYRVVILPRNMRVDTLVPGTTKGVLEYLRTVVITAGVHVLASADLPGMQNPVGRPMTNFVDQVKLLFGVDASNVGGVEGAQNQGSYIGDFYTPITVTFTTNAVGAVAGGYTYTPRPWKYSDETAVSSGGVLWAEMDTWRNKGFEDSNVVVRWGSWYDTNYAAAGMAVQTAWGWQLSGNRMLQMWGDAGLWQDVQAQPFGRYSASTYLRNNSDDPLKNGSVAYVALEWYGKDGRYLGVSESQQLATNTPGNTWVWHGVDTFAPSNTYMYRRLIRINATNLLSNGDLTGTGVAPNNWSAWNDANHDPDTSVFLGAGGNCWTFWYDGGIYQDVTNGFSAGNKLKFGGYLYTPANDRLRNGTKYGTIQLEFYSNATLMTTVSASPTISAASTNDWWLKTEGLATVPTGANKARLLVRCNDYASGEGVFKADNVFLRNVSRAGGSVYVDNYHKNPAVVVKNHTTAKSAIFLYAAGDMSPDGDMDVNHTPDVLPWKWRYDVLGSVIKDYFGVQPKIYATGTNAYLCLPEYRTATNGAILMQVKNYLYDSTQPGGGAGLTFTINSTLVTGKTIIAYEQGRVVETNSDGVFSLTLGPNGQEMLLAYAPGTNVPYVIEIADAPSLVRPVGNQSAALKLRYDCLSATNLKLKVAFKEKGNNGDSLTNEIYAVVTNAVTGQGEWLAYVYIPDCNLNDTDYKSTADGGKYEFAAWLENGGGARVKDAVPRNAILAWGVRPTTNFPATATKGGSVSVPIEWENLYEQLPWQNTPMSRNSSFPGRVALYRSLKTESQFTGHLARANAAANWLESMGYTAGNPLDISFDDVVVSNLYSDNFEDGDSAGWTRQAGAANWEVGQTPSRVGHGKALRYDSTRVYNLNSTNAWLSFKVIANTNKTVDKIYLYTARVGNAPVYNLGLFSDNSGIPGGAALSSGNFTSPSTSYGWTTVEMTNVAWTAGQAYHFVVRHVSGAISTTNNYLRVQYVGPDAEGRKVLTSANRGTSWTSQTNDPVFRVLYSDSTSFAQPYATFGAVTMLGATRYGQQFQLTRALNVTNIALYIRKQSTANGDISLRIRRWSDKAVLATSTVSRTLVSTTNGWVSFGYRPALQLGTTTQYFFEIVNLGTTGYYYANREYAPSYGAYTWDLTNNACVYSANTGVTWTAQGHYDLGYALTGYIEDKALRAWRIGNDDNILTTGSAWTNYSVSADILYRKQGPYFNDAEIFLRYQNRSNYYKVGIHNFYGFWRLRYMVKQGGVIQQQGWLYDFPKATRPVEGQWYNLRVECNGITNTVYFDGQYAGRFWATNFATGRIGLGTRAVQLGIWEPQKGYYFIDDDEYSYYAPEGQQATKGSPLNLDWGYLVKFFPTLILPSTYVMSDVEVSNVTTWLNLGLFSVIATDGGIAMKNEAGATDLGRIEGLFGVGPAIALVSNLTKVTVGTNDHYVTQDYASCAQVGATGGAVAWTTLAKGRALGAAGGSATTSVLIVNTLTNDPLSPKKVFCFNMGADTQGQLTNSLKNLAARAFEWARGEAHKVRVELKYTPIRGSLLNNITVASWEQWVLGGTGSNLLSLVLPGDGIMTGDNLFWVTYMYPWDAEDAWLAHDGFYTSSNDGSNGLYTSISGLGLQVLGVTETAFAGRDWDTWVAYNTRSTTVSVAYGIKDKGATQYEDNFSDGNYTGWNVVASPRIAWSVSNNALQAKVISVTTGDYGYIYWNGLAVTGKNITIEYSTMFTNNARDGGVIYRGRVLYVNPNLCGWADNTPNYFATNRPVPNKWQKVVVQIRDGSPYLMSDLFVDGKTVFLSEPIQVTSWTTNTVGFLSPYSNLNSVARWDNVRIADEQYSVTYTNVLGEKVPTNAAVPTFWPGIPDYDPQWWEHDGTTYGAGYEWYVYMHGEGLHGYADTKVYFAPRLRVELSTFPTNLSAATNVVVPIEWEKLPTNSAKLCVRLWDAYSGLIHVAKTSAISGVTGTTNVPVTVPTMPAGSNYVWTAFIFPNTATNPWVDRFGSDDTFRFDDKGIGVEPETMIRYTAPPATGGFYNVYSDGGIPVGASVFTWDSYRDWGVGSGPATFNGDYTGITPPEGTKCYLTATTNGTTYGGWGIFRAATDMRSYTNGYLKFWIRSGTPIKINLEGPQYTKGTVNVPSTTNTWQERSLPISSFSGIVLTNMYGLFEATVESTGAIFYIDNVRWSLTP